MFNYIKNQYLWFKIKNTSLLNGDIDNLIFKNRLMLKFKWSNTTCDDMILQYKQFLFIAATSNEKETPTQAVDDVWHEHILYTRDYFENWAKLLGKTIHHEPDREINPAKTKQVFEKTQLKLDALRAKAVIKKPTKDKISEANYAKISESNYSHSGGNDLTNALLMSSMISNCSSHSSTPSESSPAEAPAASHCGSSSSHCSSSSGSSGSSCSSSSCSSSSCGSGGD
jgi:hypothetical protein